MTPHPQRCETCKNVDCGLHEQSKGNRNPETGYEWDHHYWYHKIIDEVGCASHSSASEPVLKTSDPVWHCVVCGAITQKSHEHKYQEILEQTRKQELGRVLSCVQEDVNDLTKEVALGVYTNQGIFEELQKLSCRIDNLRQQEGEP